MQLENRTINTKKHIRQEHERVDEILTIYKENDQIIDGMVRIGEETIHIGTNVTKKLKEQTERMDIIQKDLDNLGDGLKRAKNEVKAFFRGTNCDKVVICIFIIVILLMVCVIVGWQVAKYVCIKGSTNTCIGGYSNNVTSITSFLN